MNGTMCVQKHCSNCRDFAIQACSHHRFRMCRVIVSPCLNCPRITQTVPFASFRSLNALTYIHPQALLCNSFANATFRTANCQFEPPTSLASTRIEILVGNHHALQRVFWNNLDELVEPNAQHLQRSTSMPIATWFLVDRRRRRLEA